MPSGEKESHGHPEGASDSVGADDRVTEGLRQLLDALPAAVFLKDGLGRYVECNAAYEAFAGRSRSAMRGKTDWAVFPRDLASEIVWQDMTLRSEGGVRQFELATSGDGAPVPPSREDAPEVGGAEKSPRKGRRCFQIVKSLVPQGAGESGIVGVQLDISARKEEEDDLRAALEAAEEANRSKSEFLASMSHEIRTPLNAILGMTDLLLSMGTPREQRELLENVRISGQALLQIINDILDLSKIEAHHLVLDWDLFAPRESLDVALRPLAPLARNKNLSLELAVDPEVPAVVLGDEIRFRQVLVNLVSNAIKYTERGGVCVSVTTRRPRALFLPGEPAASSEKGGEGEGALPPGMPSSGKNALELAVSVRDTGVGIPASRLEHLFQSFSRVEGAMARKLQGTGLGLFISKRLVEAMGGTISVESREGAGSTFAFTVRLGTAPEGSVLRRPGNRGEAPVEGLPEQLRVLLAEDNPMNSKLARILLERKGWTVEGAGNGQEALRCFRSRRYDLILMDVQMPEMDGLEATALVRQEEGAGQHVPIIAMTAYAMKGDRERCLAAGMDGYVSKPISPEELFRTIAEVLGKRAEGASVLPEVASGGVDLSRLLRIVGGDRGILADVVQEFLDLAPGMAEALRDALERGALAEAQKAAHKLRGSVSYFGVAALTDLAVRLEGSCKEERPEGARELWIPLESALKNLVEELGRMKSRRFAPQSSGTSPVESAS